MGVAKKRCHMSDFSPLALFVRKLNQRVALGSDDKQLLLNLPHSSRELKASATIVREGEVPGPCAILIHGFAFRHKIARDGTRQIVSLQIPGDALDMQHLFLDCADHNVQAMTDVSLAMVPRTALRAVALQSPSIAHAFAVSNLVEASIFREWLLNIGRRDALQRVAHLLCELATRLEGQDLVGEYGFELPMSQEQIGDATGLTAVHVNRTLKRLVDQGLLVRAKRIIRIPNLTALKRVAGFNPLYLHLAQQNAAA